METIMITMPAKVDPIEVEIVTGTEYPDELWRVVTATIDAAGAEVVKARAVKRQAEIAYEAALVQRNLVQIPRDQMIITDRRTPAQVGRLAGVGRARCSVIRISAQQRKEEA
jgi:UTP:GlnB (protein PII) uridylyltransferase